MLTYLPSSSRSVTGAMAKEQVFASAKNVGNLVKKNFRMGHGKTTLFPW